MFIMLTRNTLSDMVQHSIWITGNLLTLVLLPFQRPNTNIWILINSQREKLINARRIASVLYEVLKTVTSGAGPQVLPSPPIYI